MAHRLGFYWDDWPTIWFNHFLGPASFKESFAIDRPLLGYLFMLTTPLLGENPLGWQLFAILTRWLSALALCWTLRLLWPKHGLQVSEITILYLIYPGFSQQFIAVTYSHVFLVTSIFFISLAAMIWALRNPAWFWPLFLLSIMISALCLFISEYYFGLELLRPFILWLVLTQLEVKPEKRIKKVLRYWIPYIMIMALFLVWRMVLHPTPRGEVTIFKELGANSLQPVMNLVQTIWGDLWEVNVLTWGLPLNLTNLTHLDNNLILRMVAVIFISIAIVFFTLLFVSNNNKRAESKPSQSRYPWGLQAIIVGVLALLAAGWPVWATNLHIELLFPWDRFTLVMMLGSSILLVGIVDLLTRSRMQSAVVIALITGLASGYHYQNALVYRKEWLAQRDFFWQLVWRAPAIKPDTILITSELPFTYYSDNSLTAPLNWTYAPDYQSVEMPYYLYDLEARIQNWYPELKADTPIQQTYRAAEFNGSSSQSLVMIVDPPRCLKILDPTLDRYWPQKPVYISDVLALSNPGLIETGSGLSATPPVFILGPEPEHEWCYYFEKAELARQIGDWDTVAHSAEKALKYKKKLYGGQAAELVTFAEGYAHIGQWDKATQLTLEAYQVWPYMQDYICYKWKDIDITTLNSEEKLFALAEILDKIDCSLP